MWNLLKSVFRSLSKNKIAVIGLTFLIFISIGVYTVLSSCTTNISNTYKKICNESNLHDFTVNELYRNADPVYELNSGHGDASWSSVGYSSDGALVPWAITNTEESSIWTRTYRFELEYDATTGDDSDIYTFWEKHHPGNQWDGTHVDLFYPELTINSRVPFTYWFPSTHTSTKTYEEIRSELNTNNTITNESEQKQIDDFIKSKEIEIVNYVNSFDSPMQEQLESMKNRKEIGDYQRFKALNITSSSDNIYYKVVNSNQEDTIDKISTFDNYKNLRNSNFSNNLDPNKKRDFNPLKRFDTDECKYSDLLIARDEFNENTPDVIHTPLPTAWSVNPTSPTPWNEDTKHTYSQYIESKLLLLSLSDDVSGIENVYENDLKPLIEALSLFDKDGKSKPPTHWQDWDSDLQQHYNDFVNAVNPSTEQITNKGYRLTIHWTGSGNVPYSWRYDLWVSKFAFVNPQHMHAKNKKPLDPSLYEKNESYKSYKDSHGGSASLEDWLNSIPFKDKTDTDNDIIKATSFQHWFDLVCKQYPQYTVANTSGIQTQYIILGAGISANFIYPVVSLDRIVPNSKNECIIFTNNFGYQRINDAFRTSEVESYFVCKFEEGQTKSQRRQVLNNINDPKTDPARESMMYPSSINIAYMNNDTSNVLSPAALRIAFIPSLISNLSTASSVLTIFILILSLIICAFVINNYISNKRMEIGIMRANGVRRRKIVFSLIPFALLPAIIGGFIGYIVGFGLQQVSIGLFHTYWTIPTNYLGFNIWTLLISILIPFLICFVASAITTIFILRKPTVQLFKSDGIYKSNFISRYINRPFAYASIISRYRISIAFNFIWKLLILSIMSALAMSSIIFAMSINGKFDYAKNTTYASQKYNYAIDLYSPTNQGGQYIPYDSNYIGQNGFVQSNEGINFIPNNMYDSEYKTTGNEETDVDNSYNVLFGDRSSGKHNFNLSKNYYQGPEDGNTGGQLMTAFGFPAYQSETYDKGTEKSFANVLYPNVGDGIGQQIDINYLKNRSMVQSFLNFSVGTGAMSTNPWKIAVSLMPENNKNISDSKSESLINNAGLKAFDPDSSEKWHSFKNLFKLVFDAPGWDPHFHYEFDESNCLAPFGAGLTPEFLEFEHYLYSPDFVINGESASNLDYNLQYNQVPLDDDDDETYTYLSGTGVSNNIKDKDIRIVGLKKQSKMISLLDKNNKDISDRIITTNPDYRPIIVNAFAAKKHNLKIGDNISINVKNKANRFDNILNSTKTDDEITFKIVGINQTFQNEEYFVSQDLANNILELRNSLGENPNFHNWYQNYLEADKTLSPLAFLGNVGDGIGGVSDLKDLSHIDTTDTIDDNVTPYGFNGVFTKSKSGGMLNNGFYLYSPSGLYPAGDSWSSKDVNGVMKWGANLEIANETISNAKYDNNEYWNTQDVNSIRRKIRDLYNAYQADPTNQDKFKSFTDKANDLTKLLSDTFGNTAYRQTISNVIDKLGTQAIYDGLSNTVNDIEVVVLFCMTLLTSLIVILISNMLISDSKRLGAILKALGYSDISNLESFLSVYVPTILIGIIIAIPLSILFVYGFNAIIFNTGILLTTNIKWWFYLVGTIGLLGLLSVSGFIGYYQLTKESLVKQLKTN